jgi:hypothetical protein
MVKRTGDVSHVLVTEQERLYKPSYGTYGVSVRRRKRWKRVVGPEEFVRSIDQVDFQVSLPAEYSVHSLAWSA